MKKLTGESNSTVFRAGLTLVAGVSHFYSSAKNTDPAAEIAIWSQVACFCR